MTGVHRKFAARAALVLLTLLAARPTHAQLAVQVHGDVRDSASAQPIPGAVVSLLDSAGHVSVRGIADEAGRFALTLTGPVKRVQVVRIGFHPRDLALSADLNAPLTIAMGHLPAMLEDIRVSDRTLCPGSKDRGDAFSLWEQARAALLATIVARETKPASVLMLTYQREIDPGNESIMSQTVHQHRGTSGRPFTASHSPSEFAKVGYLQETDGGELFSAPDADVLLDESFAGTHCFRVLKGAGDHRDQVGLGFEPAPGATRWWTWGRALDRSRQPGAPHIGVSLYGRRARGGGRPRRRPAAVSRHVQWRRVHRALVHSHARGRARRRHPRPPRREPPARQAQQLSRATGAGGRRRDCRSLVARRAPLGGGARQHPRPSPAGWDRGSRWRMCRWPSTMAAISPPPPIPPAPSAFARCFRGRTSSGLPTPAWATLAWCAERTSA